MFSNVANKEAIWKMFELLIKIWIYILKILEIKILESNHSPLFTTNIVSPINLPIKLMINTSCKAWVTNLQNQHPQLVCNVLV